MEDTPARKPNTDGEVDIPRHQPGTDGTPTTLSHEEPSPDLNVTRTGTCYGCDRIDGDISVCDHCELPHHHDCLIPAPTDGDNRYCPGCMGTLFSRPHHSPLPNQESSSEDSDLSEPSSHAQASDSGSEYAPSSQVRKSPGLTDTGVSHASTAKYELRPRPPK